MLAVLHRALGDERERCTTPRFLRVAGRLLCTSESRLWRLFSDVTARRWDPVPTPQSSDCKPPQGSVADLDRDSRQVMMTLVRTALSESARGCSWAIRTLSFLGQGWPRSELIVFSCCAPKLPRGPDWRVRRGLARLFSLVWGSPAPRATAVGSVRCSAREYVQCVARLELHGVDVGDKFHSSHFLVDALHLGGRCLQARDAQERDAPLGGLGIASNLGLLFDGVPVGGASLHGRHGNVLVVCFSSVSPHNHRLQARFATWTVSSTGHGGAATAKSLLELLEKPPMCMDQRSLRARLSMIGGDGQIEPPERV